MDWVSPADSLVSTHKLEILLTLLASQLLIGCADNKIKMFDVNSQMCLWDVNADKNTKYVYFSVYAELFDCSH